MTNLTTLGVVSSSSQDVLQQVPPAFLSTYKKEYTGTSAPPAPNARVQMSRFYPPGQPAVDSTYRTHYFSHQSAPRIKVPFGSSSGCRNNNPHPHNMEQVFNHPLKDYFVWSHYRKLPPVNRQAHAAESSSISELLKKVCQDKTRSIYQQDYVPRPPLQDLPSSSNGRDGGGLYLER